jgi:hypothetical protein
MKKFLTIFMIATLLAGVISSCKKDATDPPSVTTAAVSSVTSNSAVSGGDVTSIGSSDVTARGACWSKVANPTVADAITTDGVGIGVFTSNLANLTPGTVYHVRAYATNSNGTAYGADVTFSTSYLIKSVSFAADWAGGTEMWEFAWNATTKKLSSFNDYWEGTLDKAVTYDYSVPGKLTLNKDGAFYREYDIDSNGHIIKDYDSGNTYEYNADGFLVKVYEFWGGADHLKYEMTLAEGNISKITTFDDDGVTAKKIKEFSYTIGDNINGIHQANATDSEWMPMGNFYGKPSKKLVDFFEYWDPRVTPIEKSKSSLVYALDSKDRISTATKTLADATTEVWTYTYYEE